MPSENPIRLFRRWFEKARKKEKLPEACCLSTITSRGKPAARFVLLKQADTRGFVFYTNLTSPKARQLQKNPYAALTFFLAGTQQAGPYRRIRQTSPPAGSRPILRNTPALFPNRGVGKPTKPRFALSACLDSKISRLPKKILRASGSTAALLVGVLLAAALSRVLGRAGPPFARSFSLPQKERLLDVRPPLSLR